jgi:hypothetical protein
VPFTPFHLGPGALFKVIGGDRFSFLIFGGSQVLMDIEPVVRMIRGDAILHGVTHTVAGALPIAIIAAAVGRPIINEVIRIFNFGMRPIDWTVASVSALIGTYSHIGLDAIMHRDMNPLWPIINGNHILGVISVGLLHALCVAAGLFGGSFVGHRALRKA